MLPELAPAVEPLLQQVLTTAQPILNIEIAAEVPSQPGTVRYWLGSYFPILENNPILENSAEVETVGVGVIIIEVSDRKRAEVALKESEAKFRSLSESSPVGIFMTDTQAKTIYVNPRAQEICGYTFEEALDDRWMQFVHPNDLQNLVDTAQIALINREPGVFTDARYIHKDGSVRYAHSQFAPIFAASGEFLGFVGTIEDITERYQLEQMKAEFISNVSHELRTPLTSITGALELLSTGLIQSESERGRETIAIAATEAERFTRLVNDILDLERLESGKIRLELQLWDLAQLMSHAADFMQFTASQTAITLSVTPLSIVLEVDGERVLQVLTNLLSNAIKFSPSPSTIWLTAEVCHNEPLLGEQASKLWQYLASTQHSIPGNTHSALIATASYILVTVRDQGQGIPADKLEIIFERFHQVNASDSRRKGGTGLGLAICRNIVQQHGGYIWAESDLGQGSSFHFTLPLTAKQ